MESFKRSCKIQLIMTNPCHIYFLSTGRCGTTYLYEFFKVFYPELKLTHQKKGSRIINILSNLGYSLQLNSGYFKTILLLKKNTYPASNTDPLRSIAVFKCIKDEDTNRFKVVHLIRDPREFVTSFMNWKSSSLKKRILHNLIHFWNIFPKGCGINYLNWLFMPKFEKFCWVWYTKNSLFKKLENNTDYYLVKIEDITKSINKHENMSELINFLGLDMKEINYSSISQVQINKSTTRTFPKFEYWSDDEKKTLYKICGHLMEELGYLKEYQIAN